jgi:exodeoxyribonuclease V gamma subunit
VLRLEAEAQAGGGAVPLARAVVKGYLTAALDEPGPARRFITGAVTCCALAPMRAIPFRVVCVLGLNDGEFPRRARPAEFDRLAGDYRPGDRVPREDDRYLMLEALLAARDTLHLSYIGRRQTDNAPLPPSALVTELTDVLRQMRPGGARVVEHPLQAFSARYGREADLVTYAGEWFERAPPAPVFAAAPLAPDPRSEPDDWTLDDLLRFVRSPARWFLQGRLGIRLRKLDEAPADDEPFYLDGLDGYAVGQQLVAARLAGQSADDAYRALRGTGALPAAAAGRRVFDRAWDAVADLAARAAPLLAHPKPDRLIDLDIAGTALTGRVSGLAAAGLVDCQYSRDANGPRLLSLWVRHLALNAAGEAVASHLLTREQTVRLAPVRNAAQTLADLLALARQGLCEPLPLLPKSALAYAEADDPDKGMKAAWRTWSGDEFNDIPGEQDDPDVQLAFRGRQPLAEPAFATLATRVFGPLLAVWGAE